MKTRNRRGFLMLTIPGCDHRIARKFSNRVSSRKFRSQDETHCSLFRFLCYSLLRVQRTPQDHDELQTVTCPSVDQFPMTRISSQKEIRPEANLQGFAYPRQKVQALRLNINLPFPNSASWYQNTYVFIRPFRCMLTIQRCDHRSVRKFGN